MIGSALTTVSLVVGGLELDTLSGIIQGLVDFFIFQASSRTIRVVNVVLRIKLDGLGVANDGLLPLSILEGGITLFFELELREERRELMTTRNEAMQRIARGRSHLSSIYRTLVAIPPLDFTYRLCTHGGLVVVSDYKMMHERYE